VESSQLDRDPNGSGRFFPGNRPALAADEAVEIPAHFITQCGNGQDLLLMFH
jgi:hypothetical protein